MNNKKLIIEQLDERMSGFYTLSHIPNPPKGWVYSIRTALNMSLKQIAKKLNISIQAMNQMEKREYTGNISVKSMNEIAEAMDLKFVYGFVSKAGSLEKLVELKAEDLAKKIVLKTHQNMKLEDQETSEEYINKSILEIKDKLIRDINKSIWD